MKKFMLVGSLAVVLVLAFATSAFAYAPPIGLYIAWDGAGVNVNGPHADYQTNTTKCAVCHSVHAAPGAGEVGNSTTGGWMGTAGVKPELLLTTSVADACSYCHIQTNMGGVQLYGASTSLYTGLKAANYVGHRSACTMCHAVHGAGTFKGGLTAKIVKDGPLSYGAAKPIQTEVIGGTGATAGLFVDHAAAVNAPLKDEQGTAFCSQCHANFSRSADASLNVAGQRSHSMVAAPASVFTTITGGVATQYDADGVANSVGTATKNDGATIAASKNIAIAAFGSGTCRACHTAGGTGQTGVSYNSFPHYSNSFSYYLPGTVAKGNAALTANGIPGASPADASDVDGNCIVCHTNVGTAF